MSKVEGGPIDPPPPSVRVAIFSSRLLGLKAKSYVQVPFAVCLCSGSTRSIEKNSHLTKSFTP